MQVGRPVTPVDCAFGGLGAGAGLWLAWASRRVRQREIPRLARKRPGSVTLLVAVVGLRRLAPGREPDSKSTQSRWAASKPVFHRPSADFVTASLKSKRAAVPHGSRKSSDRRGRRKRTYRPGGVGPGLGLRHRNR